MKALVGEIQPNNPPKITRDAGPGTACCIVGTPSNKPAAFPIQATGKSEKRLQVSGIACLVQGVATMCVEQKADEQAGDQAVVASHL